MVEIRVVLVSDGRTTRWRAKCSECGQVGSAPLKQAAERMALRHGEVGHDGRVTIISPR
jgi:hypothetical protein